MRSTRTASAARAFELLSYPDIGIAEVARIWPQFGEFAPKIAEQLEIDAKYAVYLDRQAADVAAYRRDESFELPDDLDYAALPGCPTKSGRSCRRSRPRTIGQAGRIDGITPAALTLLVAHVRRGAQGPPRPRERMARNGAAMTTLGSGRGPRPRAGADACFT